MILVVEDVPAEEDANVVVYTRGVTLTELQIERKNNFIAERGVSMGTVFIHELRFTDIHQNGLVLH
jgi:hypothetical protein